MNAPRLEEPRRLVVVVPVRTERGMNGSRQQHWIIAKKRVDAQHAAVTAALRARSLSCPFAFPLLVTLSRIAPGRLDSDNHVSALKAVRDAVAKWIGVDDGRDDLVRWEYGAQQKSKAGAYGVRIVVEPAPARCPHCAGTGRARNEPVKPAPAPPHSK